MERVGNVVRETRRDAGRNLRAIPSHELAGEVVPKVHSCGNSDSTVGIGSVANDRSSIRQNAGAGKVFAEQIAHVRVVVVKDAIAQDVSKNGGGEIVSLNSHWEDAAVSAILGLDGHAQTGTGAADNERLAGT